MSSAAETFRPPPLQVLTRKMMLNDINLQNNGLDVQIVVFPSYIRNVRGVLDVMSPDPDEYFDYRHDGNMGQYPLTKIIPYPDPHSFSRAIRHFFKAFSEPVPFARKRHRKGLVATFILTIDW